MDVVITKEGSFCAAHRLPHHKGACRNLHGHTWQWKVEIGGNLKLGDTMLVDFGDIKKVMNQFDHKTILFVHDELYCVLDKTTLHDGTTLEDGIIGLDIVPTCERLTERFISDLKRVSITKDIQVIKVSLWESVTSFCTRKWTK